MKPLNILFLWHMHQPSYTVDDEPYFLPWTRLHATKDYIGMADVVSRSNEFKMTFNFTPVLWEQLLDYADGAMDQELLLTLKEPASLTLDERQFLLRKMFTGNPMTLIDPYPRYSELYDQFSRGGEDAAHRMSERDITDLTVWRILSWIHKSEIESSSFVQSLIEKQTGYHKEEVIQLIDHTRSIISNIPRVYKQLANSKQIAISTTPYYHPILPVLLNSESARECHVGVSLPAPFSFSENARWHVDAAIKMHQSIFEGENPAGMWPAEGSVSKEAAELFARHGIPWIASDETILFRSFNIPLSRNQMGYVSRPDLLYQPWHVNTDSGPVNMLFRDHHLSDLIGFDYQSVPINQAVSDFVKRLRSIHAMTQSLNIEPCVSIILDGENAWEHYPDGGFGFLETLFTAINNDECLVMKTIPEYFDTLTGEIPIIEDLKPGSWINGNFDIWIGQPEENIAWNCIRDLHDALGETSAKLQKDQYDKALKFLLKSQASDTFWWFGDDHFTTEKADFDALFRSILIRGYESAGLIPPATLYSPLIRDGQTDSSVSYPKNLLSPVIDGEIQSYFDWFGSGTLEAQLKGSAMHSSSDALWFSQVMFGFNLESLFVRFDPREDLEDDELVNQEMTIDLVFNSPESVSDVHIDLKFKENEQHECEMRVLDSEITQGSAIFKRILEVEVNFLEIGIRPDDRISFHFELYRGERLLGRLPSFTEIEFFAPTEDYDSLMWRV